MTTKSSSRVKITGEVFTPRSLIIEMLKKIPPKVWRDPNKRWLEPAAGDGNFLVEVKRVLVDDIGFDEKHVLENMLFSVELMDDNHFALQYRLGYITAEGQPNKEIWSQKEIDGQFKRSTINPIRQDLNKKNPYAERKICEPNQVLSHRNHVCWTALEYNMLFNGLQPNKQNTPGQDRIFESKDNEKGKGKPNWKASHIWPDKRYVPEVDQPLAVELLLNRKSN